MCLFQKNKILGILIIAFSFLRVLNAGMEDNDAMEVNKPNIIILLADDLGYGDLACYEYENIREDISQEKNLKDEYPEVFMRLKQELILFHHDVREDSPEL